MIVAAVPVMRAPVGAARVLAKYQGFDGDGNGLRGHANAPQVDVVEIPEDDAVDHENFAVDAHFATLVTSFCVPSVYTTFAVN